MQEKSCRCGASKKRFKFDIGPFYVGECCEANGFDALGNPKPGLSNKAKELVKALETGAANQPIEPGLTIDEEDQQEPVPPGPGEGEAPEPTPGDTSLLQKFFGRAGGRGKLMDMKIEDLKTMAKGKGIQGADQMTKKQLVAEILK